MSDTFLSRWARRKRSVRTAERGETPIAGSAVPDDGMTGEPDALPDIRAADASSEAPPHSASEAWLAHLPSLDALTPDSDLTLFLQKQVPAALRKAALRRMWSLDPAIRDFVSEAREYAYDWNTPGGVPGMGPLLPTDDLEAMLKRIVDGVPRPLAQPAAEAENEAPGTEVQEDANPPPETVETTSLIAADDTVEPTKSSPHIAAEEKASALADVENAPVQRPRLRRHGGAMPS